MSIETVWDYLKAKKYKVTPRTEKKTVHLVLESEKLNGAQKDRMEDLGFAMRKLDGVFSLITVIPTVMNGMEVRHWGRSGNALKHTEALDVVLKEALPDNLVNPLVFLSEITSDDPLAKLSGYLTPARVKTSTFRPTNLQDNLHDVVYLSEFIKGESNEPFYVRRDLLEGLLYHTPISIINGDILGLRQARKTALDYIKGGGEGYIFAQICGTWTAGKRDETKIKIKEKLSYDVTVIGMSSGKFGSKYEHTLGKLIVSFRAFGLPDGELLEIPISGMTDELRDLWWEHPEVIIGQVVKMDAKSFTEFGNLREPRFKEVRNDKGSDFPVEVDLGRSEFWVKGKAKHIKHLYKEAA